MWANIVVSRSCSGEPPFDMDEAASCLIALVENSVERTAPLAIDRIDVTVNGLH